MSFRLVPPLRALVPFLFLLPALACGGGDEAADSTMVGSTTQPFVAFPSSFTGFRTWKSFHEDNFAADNVHASGPRTTYVNQLPQAGDTEFPIGTIIVKEMESTPDLTQRQVFAMVKRGGGFNAAGAVDWEWFGLSNLDSQTVEFQWRGVVPVGVDAYASDPNACNSCHSMAKTNDYVQSPLLQLKALEAQ